METYTIPLDGVTLKNNTVNEQLLASIFELDLPVPDTKVREAEWMCKDISTSVDISKLAIASTEKEWVPALCGHNKIPVAYNATTNEVAQILSIEEEKFLVVREPWGPVFLPVWQEVK